MKKINLMIGLILMILFSSIVYATVTQTLNSPADLVSNQSTSFTFNWTPVSNLVAGDLTSWLFINGVINQTITKTNGSNFNTTVSGFAVGFHQWNVTTNDTGGNFTSDTRWLEVTTALNESYFNWKASGGSTVMSLHKTTGALNITGIFNAASGSTSAVNWTQLQNYPAACSSGFAVTAINDSTTCTAFLPSTGGTLTGNIALTGNNLTNISYINPGGETLTIGNNLTVGGNITGNTFLSGANVGITGNFTLNDPCWIDFNGGIATATNCTAN